MASCINTVARSALVSPTLAVSRSPRGVVALNRPVAACLRPAFSTVCRLQGSAASCSSSSFLGNGLRVGSRSRASRSRPSATPSIVAAEKDAKKVVVKKKVPTAVKRAKQNDRLRLYHKARRTEMSTRMKKVFVAIQALKVSPSPSEEALEPIEKLISAAYKIIDKSVKVGTIHRNKGANRKSRLGRAKRAISIAYGWYTPAESTAAPELAPVS
eukprot:TRINITY_DN36181_c0_g1_i1.p1 TRINITY_DN36181_c0_g1~~TRINITY_DN36181_c0_g1_i1.p1  ORF type:complete len:214 (+),score=35.04 TRINITY_DN36181_c0_g1_i1:168-809(+)